MIRIGFLLALIGILSSVVGVFVLYWVIRLAVRHGIEDAQRNRVRQSAVEAGWDPARI